MDDFVVLLIVAFVIIGAMVLVGGPLAEWAGGEWSPGGGDGNVITSLDLGRVGSSETAASRTASFGSFTLGETQAETLRQMDTLGVSAGYFGADSKKFKVRVDENVRSNLKNVRISFDIGETNLYGNLLIKWNDKVFFNRLANLNRYDFTIPPENVEASNNLEVCTAGPGLYFWASTYYSLEDFNVVGEYGPEKFLSFKLYANEIEAWSKGVLKFYTTRDQTGEITVKLNGKEIYRETNPEHLVTEDIEYSEVGEVLRIGDNILSFKSTDAFKIDDVEFEVHLSTASLIKERDFEVTAEQMNLLDTNGGEIRFMVDDIYRPGVLSISINDNQLNMQSIKTGENVIDFDPEYIFEGTNTIKFSGTGSWDISGVVLRAG